jgi:hypothetical protein
LAAWTFQDSGWRQGVIIPREFIPEGVLPPDLDREAKTIILSHDCDIVQDPGAEPFIEFVVARRLPPERKGGQYFKGKNPRVLQFLLTEDGTSQLYEISAHDRYRIERNHLEEREPDLTVQLDSRNVLILADWFSKRYKRYSFPTEFNNRIRASGKSLENIKKALERDGQDVNLFLALDPLKELPASETYKLLVRVVIARDAMEDDFREQRALKVVAALKRNLSSCPGITLIDVKLESAAQFTLEDIDNTIEWDAYEYLSVTPDRDSV